MKRRRNLLDPGRHGNHMSIGLEEHDERSRITDLILQGYTQKEIGRIIGVNTSVVSTTYHELKEEWKQVLAETRDKRICELLQKMQMSAKSAFESYLQSKENQKEVTTVRTPRRCRVCLGTGKVEDSNEWCEVCEGDGKIITEVVTTKIKGQAGDSSFLKEFRLCLEAAAKLQGLEIPKPDSHERQTNIGININLEAATPKQLLDAKVAIANLQNVAIEEEKEPPEEDS